MKNNILILAIETSSEACSAALLINNSERDEPECFCRIEKTPRQHAKLILPMLEEVLEEGGIELKDLDAIAFGRGPGAFTGLRIAAGVAQGIALSADKPVVLVSTLASLALQAIDLIFVFDGDYNNEIIAVAMDARMSEVYWGFFRFDDEGGVVLIGEEKVTKPELMFDKTIGLVNKYPNNRVFCLGSGWDVYKEEYFKLGKPENIIYLPNAQPNAVETSEVALQQFIDGDVVKPEDAQPVYLRNDVAKKSQK